MAKQYGIRFSLNDIKTDNDVELLVTEHLRYAGIVSERLSALHTPEDLKAFLMLGEEEDQTFVVWAPTNKIVVSHAVERVHSFGDFAQLAEREA